jgi:hypothetical protein
MLLCIPPISVSAGTKGGQSPNYDAHVKFKFRALDTVGYQCEIVTFICPSYHPENDPFIVRVDFDYQIGTDIDLLQDTKYEVQWHWKIDNTHVGDQKEERFYSHVAYLHGDDYKPGTSDDDTLYFTYYLDQGGIFTAQCDMVYYVYEWNYVHGMWTVDYSGQLDDYDQQTIYFYYN